MPRQKQEFSLEDILQSTEKIIPQPEVATDTTESERGQLGAARQLGGAGRGGAGLPGQAGASRAGCIADGGPSAASPHPPPLSVPWCRCALAGSKQLRTLRKRLERNRLTMPLFDTRGWVREHREGLTLALA